MFNLKLSGAFIFYCLFFCTSCTNTPIRNKQLTVGKIHKVGYSGKNGATDYIYYFNGVKYSGSTRFKELSHADMFLLYVDKTKPNNVDIPIPNIKFFPFKYDDSICLLSLGIKVEDFRLVMIDENGP